GIAVAIGGSRPGQEQHGATTRRTVVADGAPQRADQLQVFMAGEGDDALPGAKRVLIGARGGTRRDGGGYRQDDGHHMVTPPRPPSGHVRLPSGRHRSTSTITMATPEARLNRIPPPTMA